MKWKHFPRYWPFVRGINRWIPLTMTRIFDIFFVVCLNKRLSKQSISRWFETPLRPLWRHCNANLPTIHHEDFMKWKHFPRYWPFVRGINRWIPLTMTRIFDIFFVVCLNKRLSKQSISRWFETPLRPLWRHCNANLPTIHHEDFMKWKHFPRYWPFVRGINRWIPLTMTRIFDIFFVVCLNKRLSKQSISRWFETPLRPLWRDCNANLPRQNALTRESIVMHIVMPCKSIGRVIYITRFASNMRYVYSKEFASSSCVHYSFFPKYLPPNEVLQLRFFVPIEAFPHFLFDILGCSEMSTHSWTFIRIWSTPVAFGILGQLNEYIRSEYHTFPTYVCNQLHVLCLFNNYKIIASYIMK